MFFSDFLLILRWWLILFSIGIIFFPITYVIFKNFFDKGYIFSKIIGLCLTTYSIFILSFLKIFSFETQNIFFVISLLGIINLFLFKKFIHFKEINIRKSILIFLFEEIIFFAILSFWAFVHGNTPDIHGLEKYMDFGFINSILRTKYLPPLDMWFTPYFINYYYFGHLTTAVLTKISFIPSYITFNLMLSTIAALSFGASFSIGANLLYFARKNKASFKILSLGGLLIAFLLNFAGNLHTIYLFFQPYENEHPIPFWQLIFSPTTFPNSYWYPNATRFIKNTIHEFPSYSFVVSDLHGHVLDIPFVLLTIAVLFSFLLWKSKNQKAEEFFKLSIFKLQLIFISFLLAVMYMTNAWDGIIYFLLSIAIIFFLPFKDIKDITNLSPNNIKNKLGVLLNTKHVVASLYNSFIIFVGFFVFSLPFTLNFKPFASGIGILCAPSFLTNIGKLGPFLFEADHCMRSPIWQLFILYGFFYFWIFLFGYFAFHKFRAKKLSINNSDFFVFILILLSTMLIVIPEFIYVKDIYPAHYRANTMFKLVYEAFMMLSISTGYIIVRLFIFLKNHKEDIDNKSLIIRTILIFPGIVGLILVSLYSYFAINSYFGNLKNYAGLNGISYLENFYPNDYDGILWIRKNIKSQPVILEAQGDSYTDFGRISANTGLPTVLGWTVHEWLWRGTYDIPAPRIAEVQEMYESNDLEKTKTLLKKYNVSLVFAGDLEKQKYPNENIDKFKTIGEVIYEKGDTKIFKIITN